MPAAVAVPLIVGGASAGASLIGAKMQAGAAGKAAKQQQAAIANALPYLQQQAAQGRADLAPYSAIGGQGLTSLAALAGLPGIPAGSAATSLPPAATGGMVWLRSPTGQTKAVPPAQADYYIARGAQRM